MTKILKKNKRNNINDSYIIIFQINIYKLNQFKIQQFFFVFFSSEEEKQCLRFAQIEM